MSKMGDGKVPQLPSFEPKCLVCGWGACLLADTDVDCDALVDRSDDDDA